MFAKLPDDSTKVGHEETLRSNGLCRVRCIKRLTGERLEDLGISMGDAMMVLDVVQTDEDRSRWRTRVQQERQAKHALLLNLKACAAAETGDTVVSEARNDAVSWKAGRCTRRGWGCVRRQR